MTGIGGAAYPCPCGAHNIHRRPREPSAVVSLDGPRCFPGVVSFVESVCSDRVLSPRSESLQSSRFPPHSANAARDACRVVLAFNVARADVMVFPHQDVRDSNPLNAGRHTIWLP